MSDFDIDFLNKNFIRKEGSEKVIEEKQNIREEYLREIRFKNADSNLYSI